MNEPRIGVISYGGKGRTLADTILSDAIRNSEEMKLPQAYKDTKLTPEEIISRIETEKAFADAWEANAMKAQEVIELLRKQLASYRQAEEQGLLIKLPCKVGDTVYWISYFNSGINSGTIHSIRISKFGFDLEISSGTGWFWRELEKIYLTREAAEEALKGGGAE
jgi:hypothetical protein